MSYDRVLNIHKVVTAVEGNGIANYARLPLRPHEQDCLTCLAKKDNGQ